MFKAKVKAEVLKDLIGVVSTLVEDVKLNISSDGLTLRAVDPAHVAMVEINLRATAFEELKATKCEIGVDVDKFKELLKLAHTGSIITMQHDEDENRLVVMIENLTRRMSLVDTAGMSDPKAPSLNFSAKVKISREQMVKGIKAAESIADHITFITSPEHFELSAESESDDTNLKLPKDVLEELECSETVKSMFSLDYLSNMVKSIAFSDILTLNLGNNYPIKIEFDLADGEGRGAFLLAPRIEDE